MSIPEHRYVFGPVPSRRLGRSLGVDLVPFKTCTYDCIYCQLGHTTRKTLERGEYVPIPSVLAELRRSLSEGAAPDYVTLSGSGEPTLHSGLQELIEGIKGLTRIPLAVLTNGSLLSNEEVRRGLADADVVIPSLDAGDDRLFQTVNRPHPELSHSRMVEGLRSFRRDFRGQIWLEVLLVAGVTDTKTEAEKIACLARETNPDRIHLNTVERPPAEGSALPVPRSTLERFAPLFEPRGEVISEFTTSTPVNRGDATQEGVLALIARRPCTMREIADGIGIHVAETTKRLAALVSSGTAAVTYKDGQAFYVIVRRKGTSVRSVT